MTKQLRPIPAALLVSLSLAGCSGSAGPIGPNGPNGSNGTSAPVTLDFPSPYSTIGGAPLGPALPTTGNHYLMGDAVTESFSMTGLKSVKGLHLDEFMWDSTGNSCTVGTVSFDVKVNGTTVGAYSYAGGTSAGRIAVSADLAFPAVSGTGPGGDTYTIAYVAASTVCIGGGSWTGSRPAWSASRR